MQSLPIAGRWPDPQDFDLFALAGHRFQAGAAFHTHVFIRAFDRIGCNGRCIRVQFKSRVCARSRPPLKPSPAHAPAAATIGGGGKCFFFNGKRYCEECRPVQGSCVIYLAWGDENAPHALSGLLSSHRTRPATRRSIAVLAPGEVAEWLNAPHSKCGIGASLSGVRIPPSPPFSRLGP